MNTPEDELLQKIRSTYVDAHRSLYRKRILLYIGTCFQAVLLGFVLGFVNSGKGSLDTFVVSLLSVAVCAFCFHDSFRQLKKNIATSRELCETMDRINEGEERP